MSIFIISITAALCLVGLMFIITQKRLGDAIIQTKLDYEYEKPVFKLEENGFDSGKREGRGKPWYRSTVTKKFVKYEVVQAAEKEFNERVRDRAAVMASERQQAVETLKSTTKKAFIKKVTFIMSFAVSVSLASLFL